MLERIPPWVLSRAYELGFTATLRIGDPIEVALRPAQGADVLRVELARADYERDPDRPWRELFARLVH